MRGTGNAVASVDEMAFEVTAHVPHYFFQRSRGSVYEIEFAGEAIVGVLLPAAAYSCDGSDEDCDSRTCAS